MTKQFKINPDLTCPELAGYRLPQIESNGVGKHLTEYIKEKHNQAECIGFIDGYTKAREKYEFTEADMEYIFECGRNYQNNAEVTFKVSIDHLRTPRTPIAIEVEMVQVKVNPMGRIVDPMNLTQNQSSCKWEERFALNPDGTVKGRYIYE